MSKQFRVCELARCFGRGCGHVAADSWLGIGQDEMTKTFTILGLLIAGFLVAATFLGVPGPSVLQAQEDQRVEAIGTATNCRTVEVALDEGYGVSRRDVRMDCSAVQ